jgi:hypothetical protein
MTCQSVRFSPGTNNIEPAEQETIVSRVVTPDAQSEIDVEAVDDITTTGPAARRIPAADAVSPSPQAARSGEDAIPF